MVFSFFKRKQENSELANAIASGRVLIGQNVHFGCQLSFMGEGRLEIGDGAQILPSFTDPTRFVTFWTYDPNAVISIGSGTVLEGSRFGCQKRIEIGNNCYVGETSFMDTDFHSTDPFDRNSPEKVKVSPVMIENNVKIASFCAILRGVTIGADTVVRPFSIVSNSLPGGVCASGYPARPERQQPKSEQ